MKILLRVLLSRLSRLASYVISPPLPAPSRRVQ